jgi:hypothetical protein
MSEIEGALHESVVGTVVGTVVIAAELITGIVQSSTKRIIMIITRLPVNHISPPTNEIVTHPILISYSHFCDLINPKLSIMMKVLPIILPNLVMFDSKKSRHVLA